MTETISDVSLYLTIMANGPSQWTPEQVKASYEYAKSLMPKAGQAEIVDFRGKSSHSPIDKH